MSTEEKKVDAGKSKKVDTKEKKQASTDYQKYLAKVKAVAAMTDTEAWKDFWRYLQAEKLEYSRTILIEEKTRDMIICQEAIKRIDAIQKWLMNPIDDLDRFCVSMPLFAQDFKLRAVFNKALGTIQLKDLMQ